MPRGHKQPIECGHVNGVHAGHGLCRQCYFQRYKTTRIAANRKCRLKREFGITADDYKTMFDLQHGVCLICSRPESYVVKGSLSRLAVDHNHTTGEVRGLLCHQCNLIIGNGREDPDVFKQAAMYIESFRSLSGGR